MKILCDTKSINKKQLTMTIGWKIMSAVLISNLWKQ